MGRLIWDCFYFYLSIYFGYMNKTIINIKTDKELKERAQKTAKELGLPLGTIINAYLRDFIREKRVVFSINPVLNARTRKILEEIDKDIKNNRNLVGPFNSAEKAIESLHL